MVTAVWRTEPAPDAHSRPLPAGSRGVRGRLPGMLPATAYATGQQALQHCILVLVGVRMRA